MSDKHFLGIDIGGTKIAAAIVSNGKIVSEVKKINTPAESKLILDSVLGLVDFFIDKYTIKAIGIATAGVADVNNGIVLSATENLADGYSGTNYKSIIKQKYNLDVFVDNDANAAAYAEHKYGAAKELNNAVVLTFGTGIGAGIIINNGLYRGNGYAAGECGHMLINFDSLRSCNCGKNGCWESYASGNGFLTTLKSVVEQYPEYKDSIKTDPFDFYMAALKQDLPVAKKTFELWHLHIAAGLIILMNTLSPQCFIIGGGMNNLIDLQYLDDILKDKAPLHPMLKKAQFGNDAGIIGAASLVEDNF